MQAKGLAVGAGDFEDIDVDGVVGPAAAGAVHAFLEEVFFDGGGDLGAAGGPMADDAEVSAVAVAVAGEAFGEVVGDADVPVVPLYVEEGVVVDEAVDLSDGVFGGGEVEEHGLSSVFWGVRRVG